MESQPTLTLITLSESDMSFMYLCKLCKIAFLNIHQFVQHKKDQHFTEFIKTNCIVFEESTLPFLGEQQQQQHSSQHDFINEFPTSTQLTDNGKANFVLSTNNDEAAMDIPIVCNTDSTNDDAHEDFFGNDPCDLLHETFDSQIPIEWTLQPQPESEPYKIDDSDVNTYQNIPFPHVRVKRLTLKELESANSFSSAQSQYIGNDIYFDDPCDLLEGTLDSQMQSEFPSELMGIQPDNCSNEDKINAVCQPNSENCFSKDIKKDTVLELINSKDENNYIPMKQVKIQLVNFELENEVNSKGMKDKEILNEKAIDLVSESCQFQAQCQGQGQNQNQGSQSPLPHVRLKRLTPKELETANKNKPFTCETCGACFSQSGHFKNHLETHSDTRSYNCSYPNCNSAFKTHKTLRKHETQYHCESKPFNCSVPNCSKSFKTQQAMKTHSLSHTNVRRYICTQINCDKAFKQLEGLKYHMITSHSAEAEAGTVKGLNIKSYTCEICHKKFHTNYFLQDHLAVHKDDRYFKCETQGCDLAFKTKRALTGHTKRVHINKNIKLQKCSIVLIKS